MLSSQTSYPDFLNKSLSELHADKNWQTIAEARGDLDGDDNDELALVLESTGYFFETRCEGCEPQKSKARIIVVFYREKVVAQNNVFIARANEGGTTPDIKPALSIVNGQLDVFYMLTRGEDHYVFERKRKEIVLVRASKLRASHYLFRSDVVDFEKRLLITEHKSEQDQSPQQKTTKFKFDNKFVKLSELKMIGSWDIGGVFF